MSKQPKKERGVYIFTNKTNGKVYVGMSIDLKRRMGEHKKAKTDFPFHKAIRKYGWDGFNVQVIHLHNCTEEFLIDLEETLIFIHDSLTSQHGYNVTERGTSRVNVKHTPEAKAKMAETRKGMPSPNKGKKRSVESIALSSRIIQRIDLESGDTREFLSAMDAERQTGTCHSNIAKVCRGKQSQAGGYGWRYSI